MLYQQIWRENEMGPTSLNIYIYILTTSRSNHTRPWLASLIALLVAASGLRKLVVSSRIGRLRTISGKAKRGSQARTTTRTRNRVNRCIILDVIYMF